MTFVGKDGEEQHIKVPIGMSMLEAAHENDIELEGKDLIIVFLHLKLFIDECNSSNCNQKVLLLKIWHTFWHSYPWTAEYYTTTFLFRLCCHQT